MMKYKQSGVTVGVFSNALNLVNNAIDSVKSTLNGSNSNTNRALNLLQMYANKPKLIEQGKAITDAVKSGDIQGVTDAAGVRLNVAIGSSKASSRSETNSTTSKESLIKAGGTVNVQATQDDLTVQGSRIEADKNVNLQSRKNVNLLASQDTEVNQSNNKSSSNSIGVSFGVGSNTGLSVDVTASRGKGYANSNSTTYNNTHVTAGETLSIQSGKDTNLLGAVAQGDSVTINVEGNLNVQSLQDTATSQAKQKTTGISISIPITAPTLKNSFGAISQGKQTANSNYASVYEQTAIQAGTGGFNINVKNNTDLKGAVIDSKASSNKNTLNTGTLTVSDIQNHMDAKVSVNNASLNTNMLNSKYQAIKGLATNVLGSDKVDVQDSSATLTAIAPANIIIKDDATQQTQTGKTAEETVATLNRDTTNTNRVLAKPDVEALQQEIKQQQVDRVLLATTISTFTDESFRKIFLTKAQMYEVMRGEEGEVLKGEDGNPIMRALDDNEKLNLKANEGKQKLNIFTNGILNDEAAAGGYAVQMAEAPVGEKIYLIYFPDADNLLSELLIAAYQKKLEGNTFGLSNASQEIVNLSQIYGKDGLNLIGHSRGAMTIGNALEVLNSMQLEAPLRDTTVKFVGPAYSAQDAANSLRDLSGRNQNSVKLQTHLADFVGRLIGGNPSTYGEIATGSSYIKEWIHMFGESPTVHSCYGDASKACIDKYGSATTINIPASNINTGAVK